MLRSLCAAVLWLGLLLGDRPVLAEEVPAPAKTPEPVKASEQPWAYVTLMTGPLERIEASFKELGMALPNPLRREYLERTFSFIGPGGLRGSGSLGVRMGAGEPGDHAPSPIMLFPVEPEVMPLKKLTAAGISLLPGSTDTFRLNKGVLLRRTPGFLLLGAQGQQGLLAFEPELLEDRLSAPGLLAELDVNLALWRKTDPAMFYRLLNAPDASEKHDTSHVTELGRGLGMRIYERLLDRVRLSLTDAGASLRLRLALEPLAPGEIAPLPRPAFPSTVLGRVDIVYSSMQASHWIEGMTEQFLDAAERDNLFSSADHTRLDVEQFRAVIKESFTLLWTADAISIALEPMKGGKVIYHQVNQYRSPAGFTERMAALVKKWNELEAPSGHHAERIGFTTATLSGVRTTRLTLPDHTLTLDFAETDTTVRMVIAQDTRRRLPALFKAPEEGSLSSAFSGMFDPNAAVDAYLAEGKLLPFPLRLRAREDLRGQRITWTTHAEGSAAVVDVDVPKPLAQTFLQAQGSGVSPKPEAEEEDDSEP